MLGVLMKAGKNVAGFATLEAAEVGRKLIPAPTSQ
jgi:hypothetical protein